MTFYFEATNDEFVVTVGWHSWDLSDAVLPKFVTDMADDVEEMDWVTPMIHVDLNSGSHDSKTLRPQIEAFVEQLNAWCFEGFDGPVVKVSAEGWEDHELVTTTWGTTLNNMMDAAEVAGRLIEELPTLTQFMRGHHDDHWREHPKLRDNLK